VAIALRGEMLYNGRYYILIKNMEKKNSAFMKPMTVSDELAAVVGKGPMPRSDVVKKLWVYIKKNDLQDPKNKRNINADEALKKVFGGKAVVNMFEMTKLFSKHLS
jgi:chromatin remodeling complex protein RSC6